MGKYSDQSFDRGRAARRHRDWPVNQRLIFIPTSVAAIGPAVARRDVAGQFGDRQGVTQNNILAHVWLNIASAKGHEIAAMNRARLANRMTAILTE